MLARIGSNRWESHRVVELVSVKANFVILLDQLQLQRRASVLITTHHPLVFLPLWHSAASRKANYAATSERLSLNSIWLRWAPASADFQSRFDSNWHRAPSVSPFSRGRTFVFYFSPPLSSRECFSRAQFLFPITQLSHIWYLVLGFGFRALQKAHRFPACPMPH